MDQLFDLLPLILGLIWYLNRGRKKKEREVTRESTEGDSDPAKSLRDILRELEGEFGEKHSTPAESVEIEEEAETEEAPYVHEERKHVFSYDEGAQEELKRQKELLERAEQDRHHHAFVHPPKEAAKSAEPTEEEVLFNLRQAVIYDAIMRRPEY